MCSRISVIWHPQDFRGARLFSIPFIRQYLYWIKFSQEIFPCVSLCPEVVNSPILQAATMILWLVALPGFLIISSVYRIVNIMSVVVPATVCLPFLGSLGAVMIAQWTQWSPDCKMWIHSTSMHNWRYWQQSIWNCGLYCAFAEVSDFLVYQLHIKGVVLYYWSSIRCIKFELWFIIVDLNFPIEQRFCLC